MARKQQKKSNKLWNCFEMKTVGFYAIVFFFHKKFQRRLLILQHLQRKTFFHVSCKLLFNFPNNRYLPNKVGTVLRTVWTEAKISFQGCLERTSGRRKKKIFFLQNHDPRHSSKKTAEVVSVLEPEKSAHKVRRHLKNDLLLFTPLKENLQS